MDNEQRDVKELLDGNVPYKDMSEAEIESVINYKAELKYLDFVNDERRKIMMQHATNSINIQMSAVDYMVDEHKRLMDMLTVKRIKKVGE